MHLNHFESSQAVRLNQILSTLKNVYGVTVEVNYDSPNTEGFLLECKETYESTIDKIVKESAFNTYQQNPTYIKNMLLLEAVKLMLVEIAPKRRRKRKVDEVYSGAKDKYGLQIMWNIDDIDDEFFHSSVLRKFKRSSDSGNSTTQEFYGPNRTRITVRFSNIAGPPFRFTDGNTGNIKDFSTFDELEQYVGSLNIIETQNDISVEENSIPSTSLSVQLAAIAEKIPQTSDDATAFSNAISSIAHKLETKGTSFDRNDLDVSEKSILAWLRSLPRPINVGKMVRDGIAKFGQKLASERAAFISSIPKVSDNEPQVAEGTSSKEYTNMAEWKDAAKKLGATRFTRSNPLKDNESIIAMRDDFVLGEWFMISKHGTINVLHESTEDVGIIGNVETPVVDDIDSKVMSVASGDAQAYEYQASMARSELYRNSKYAVSMIKQIDPNAEISPWIAAALTKSANYLDKVYHYLDYYRNAEPDKLPEGINDVGEFGKTSGSIARMNLFTIMEYSVKLFDMIKPTDKLEGWVAMKLTTASEAISSCKHYLDYVQFEQNGLDDHFDLSRRMNKKSNSLAEMQEKHMNNKTLEAKNHLGEKEYNTYPGWKAAIKKAANGKPIKWIGDKDIGEAQVDGRSIGEWDGEKGCIYNVKLDETAYEKDMDDSKSVVVKGVKGVKSIPFSKKFPNKKAADKWIDANADDIDVRTISNESRLMENEDLAKASTVLAAKDMSSKLQDVAEDIAKMGVEDLMPLVDIMRGQFGTDSANGFNASVKAALDALLNLVTETKDIVDEAITTLQGGGIPNVSSDMEMTDVTSPDGVETHDGSDISSDLSALDGGADAPVTDIGEPEEPLGRAKKDDVTESQTFKGASTDKLRKLIARFDDDEPQFSGFAAQEYRAAKAELKRREQEAKKNRDSKSAINEDEKSHLSKYKRKHVQGLHNYDHFEHEDGSWIQSRHGKETLFVHSDKDGNQKEFNNLNDLKTHVNSCHSGIEEVAPPSKAAEEFIRTNKEAFLQKYGEKNGTKILYATAWKKFGKTHESYDAASSQVMEAKKAIQALESELSAHKKAFAILVKEGKRSDPLKLGYGLEGESLIDQINEHTAKIKLATKIQQKELHEGVVSLLKNINVLNKVDTLNKIKTETPFGVIYTDKNNKRVRKMFESQQTRDYWIGLNRKSVSNIKLIESSTIDKVINKAKKTR